MKEHQLIKKAAHRREPLIDEREKTALFKTESGLTALELAEETDIVLGEETEVLDTVFEIGDTLDSHAESITGIDLAVNAARLQHVRVHHSASENLHPSGALAERTAFSAADIATDIHLGTRLREWEIGGAETNLGVSAEHLLGEIQERFAEVRIADILVDIESLHLMEETVCPCRDGFVTIDPSGTENADRRFLGGHDARLYG